MLQVTSSGTNIVFLQRTLSRLRVLTTQVYAPHSSLQVELSELNIETSIWAGEPDNILK